MSKYQVIKEFIDNLKEKRKSSDNALEVIINSVSTIYELKDYNFIYSCELQKNEFWSIYLAKTYQKEILNNSNNNFKISWLTKKSNIIYKLEDLFQ